MKRHNSDFQGNYGGGDYGGGMQNNKRSRNYGYDDALAEGKFELRLLIPTKSAGAVIGKGGEFIKAVRAKFDATVTVPDKSTPERVLTIVCHQDTVHDCFAEILAKLAEDQRKEECEVRMLVHQSHAGAIIGRGGSKIKELRELTQAQLKVFQECCPMSTDRIVLITADQSKIPGAIKAFVEFLREIPIKGNQKPYDGSTYDPRMYSQYGGYSPDRNYSGGNSYGAVGGGMPPRGPPPPMPPMSGQYDYNRAPPGPYGNQNSQGYGRQGGAPIPPMGMAPPGGFMGGEPVTTTQVTIPNELGGTIIGKGGERINRIRGESGARIDVGNAYGNDERIITISGTPHQIQTAQYLLQQSVRTSEAGRRYLREQR